MTRMTFGSLALGTLLLGVAACSSSSKSTTPVDSSVPLAPTFTNVYSAMIKASGCTQVQCHGGIAAGNLNLGSQTAAYTSLVGVLAAGPCDKSSADASADAGLAASLLPTPVCGCGPSGKTRVVAGDPDHSLLVEKLKGNPSCGEPMPQTGEPISSDLLALVVQWIKLGAKND